MPGMRPVNRGSSMHWCGRPIVLPISGPPPGWFGVIALIQRATHGCVRVGGEPIGQIGPGLVCLVGVAQNDGPTQARRLAERVMNYRVFPDDAGRMNRSVRDQGGGVLAVPQFTLAADTRRGNRPSFTRRPIRPMPAGCSTALSPPCERGMPGPWPPGVSGQTCRWSWSMTDR